MIPGNQNANLESELEDLPDQVAFAFENWRTAEEALKRHEALEHIRIKAINPEMTATDIRAHVTASDDIYKERLEVIKLEAEHMRLLEKHLSNKKRAGFRTAY